MKRIHKYFLLAFAGAVAAMPASGAAVCSISSTGVAFGGLDLLPSTTKDALGTIIVTCVGVVGDAASYSIALSAGGGNFASRAMQGGGPQLRYNLYSDAAHSLPWGDGTGGTSIVSDSYKLPAATFTKHYTVYGRIPAGHSGVPAGSYTDTLTITLLF